MGGCASSSEHSALHGLELFRGNRVCRICGKLRKPFNWNANRLWQLLTWLKVEGRVERFEGFCMAFRRSWHGFNVLSQLCLLWISMQPHPDFWSAARLLRFGVLHCAIVNSLSHIDRNWLVVLFEGCTLANQTSQGSTGIKRMGGFDGSMLLTHPPEGWTGPAPIEAGGGTIRWVPDSMASAFCPHFL